MKLNQLVSNEQRAAVRNATGESYNEDRASGRTTAEALVYLGDCMLHPGKVATAQDYLTHGPRTHYEGVDLTKMALAFADNIGLQFITIVDRDKLRYDIFLEI